MDIWDSILQEHGGDVFKGKRQLQEKQLLLKSDQ